MAGMLILADVTVALPAEQQSILAAFDWQTLYAFLGAMGVIIGVGIALGVLQSRSISNAKDAASAKKVAEMAQYKAETIERTLADYKVEAARLYASKETIEQMESRTLAAVNRLGDRLDRWLDERRGPK